MKRILFYAGVTLVAVCLTGGFATIFWFLISTMTAVITKSEFSAFAALFIMPLLVLVFLVLTAFMFFSVGFFIYRADLFYRMRTRAFKVLRNDPAERWREQAFFPEPYFTGDLAGFSYFAQKPDRSSTNYASSAEDQSRFPWGREKNNKGAGDKGRIPPVEGGRTFLGDPPGNRVFLSKVSAGRGDNIRPFPKQPKNRHKK
jgi:hypothetical protein